MKRKVDDRTYLQYLLQSLNLNDLKQICRDFGIKGFSRLKKAEFVDFVLDSLSEEEIADLINQKELEIITPAIDLALNKIKGKDNESLSAINIVNPENHEIEMEFKGFNWSVKNFVSIKEENIDDPERDCDCRIGTNQGFCSHFWVGFIFSLKNDYFKLSDWTLTALPEDMEGRLKDVKIAAKELKDKDGKAKQTINLVDKGSEEFHLTANTNKSITIYEGEIELITEKQQEYQGNITIYYILSLKNVRFGPRIQRKSDFKEEDIVSVPKLNIRISEKLKRDIEVENGDKIKGNGKLTRDNFLRMFIVKNIRKIEKV